jgi:hypothetical protein
VEHPNTVLSRSEFVRIAITKGLFALAAIMMAILVYDLFDVSNFWIGLALLLTLLSLFFYPLLKRRYGERIWNSLPHPVQQVARVLRIIALVLYAVFLLLLVMALPWVLVFVCIDLWLENHNLHKELEKRDAQLYQAG